MLTRENIAEHQRRHGLSYHVPYALEAQAALGLRGKSVLEIGGSLPERFVADALGVRQWIAIEEMGYWHEAAASGGSQGTPPVPPARPLASASAQDAESSYQVFSGSIEELPPALQGRFDAAFSIAAFEHIERLGPALAQIHAALRPGGRLFAMFSPIWSAFDGHHLPEIRDCSGRAFSFMKSPIPPWGHLLLQRDELLQYLLDETDGKTAAEIAYYVFDSTHINRLFSEDYEAHCRASAFSVERCEPTFPVNVPAPVQEALESRYPGRKSFGNNGLLLVLRK